MIHPFILAFALASPSALSAEQPIPVQLDESKLETRFEDGFAKIHWPVVNEGATDLAVSLRFQILDGGDASLASIETARTLRSGANQIEVAMPFQIAPSPHDDLGPVLAARLAWRLQAEGYDAPMEGLAGLLGTSPGLFALTVSSPYSTRLGEAFSVHVEAANPQLDRPAAGAVVQAALQRDGDTVSTANAVLDRQGIASLILETPSGPGAKRLNLNLVVRLGDYARRSNRPVVIYNPAEILLGVDKPIYQPGETLKARVLAYRTGLLLADRPVQIQVYDSDYTQVFKASLKTSELGVAATEWRIPEELAGGYFRVAAELDDPDGDDSGYDGRVVEIRRYELPTFVVQTETDREDYRPGDSPEVRVRAHYLSGQPLADGEVRITRRSGDDDENPPGEPVEVASGRLREGVFTATIDLESAREALADDPERQQTALSLTATVRDPTTRRSEQRLFSIPVSRGGIHLSAFGHDAAKDGSLQFFVHATLPNGDPAVCDFSVRQPVSKEDPQTVLLGEFRTNRFGLAKVTVRPNSKERLMLTAEDGQGRSSSTATLRRTSELRLWTDRSLHRRGDAVAVNLWTSEPPVVGFLELRRKEGVLLSQRVEVGRDGARILVPYQPGFTGLVTASFFSADGQFGDERTVLFPERPSVVVETDLGGRRFRPGETVEASFAMRQSEGAPIDGVLGLLALDRSVLERVRTDSGFEGELGSSFLPVPDYQPQLAGLSVDSLSRLKLEEPPPADLELATEALMTFFNLAVQPQRNRDPNAASADLFAESPLGKRLEDVKRRLQTAIRAKDFGSSASAARDWLSAQSDSLRDPWGNPFRVEVKSFFALAHIGLKSAGADEAFGTSDDVSFIGAPWDWFGPQEDIIRAVLEHHQRTRGDSFHDLEALRDPLLKAGLQIDDWSDPWGQPLRLSFRYDRDLEILEVLQGGQPDSSVGDRGTTLALFKWPYFTAQGHSLEQALEQVRRRTGRAIDQIDTLKAELRREGFDLEKVTDHWGRPCQPRLEIEQTLLLLSLVSPGENERFSEPDLGSDDFTLWKTVVADTFSSQRREILEALKSAVTDQPPPSSLQELIDAARIRGARWEEYRDYWGSPLLPLLKKDTAQVWRAESEADSGPTQFQPVKQELGHFSLVSRGPDREPDTADDFQAVDFTFAISETPDAARRPLTKAQAAKLSKMTRDFGGILGRVIDESGQDIPGALAIFQDPDRKVLAKVLTDESGEFAFSGIPTGPFRIVVELEGFRRQEILAVATPGTIQQVTVSLSTGDLEITVGVGYGLASVSSMISEAPPGGPPLRKYFPETLLWEPELPTDDQGRARVRFQLADTLTTWQLEALGATRDGRLAQAVAQFTTFQPFYVDLDPPPFLTVGDELGLSPVIRNYTESDQAVGLQTEVGEGLQLLPAPGQADASRLELDTPAGRSAVADFRLRAAAPARSAAIRVTAIGGDAGDAIEKSVRILPDGERIAESLTLLWNDHAEFPLEPHSDTVPGSESAQLVFYPGVLAEAVEAVDALLDQPGGCAEQTASLGLANVEILRVLKSSGRNSGDAYDKALRLTRETAERLAAVRRPDGGVPYWSKGEPSVCLTAYVAKFFREAGEFVEIDSALAEGSVDWLIARQEFDGKWDGSPLTTLSTALFQFDGGDRTREAANRALESVQPLIEHIADPLVLATYVLLAAKLDRVEPLAACLDKLSETASRLPSGSAYWTPVGGTPFFGWGRAGQIETTAAVLAALQAGRRTGDATQRDRWAGLAVDAAAFLSESKDSSGGWHSTRAAAAALEALFDFAGGTLPAGGGGRVDVLVGGRKIADLEVPAASFVPVRFDLTPWIDAKTRSVSLVRSATDLNQVARLTRVRHRPWSASDAGNRLQVKNGFQFRVKFDRTQAGVGEPIAAEVEVQRFNWPAGAPRGMALAVIGLPPGADLDRVGLDSELARVGWRLGRYEMAPGRLTLYFWPSEKPVKIAFQFRSRYIFSGVAPSSRLYDYYNPDAAATLLPVEFRFR